jgi:hypothetical protein
VHYHSMPTLASSQLSDKTQGSDFPEDGRQPSEGTSVLGSNAYRTMRSALAALGLLPVQPPILQCSMYRDSWSTWDTV